MSWTDEEEVEPQGEINKGKCKLSFPTVGLKKSSLPT
jgi:hypothetical protein